MPAKSLQVDAFTDRPFSSNPAAVVALDVWPEAGVMQAIAGRHGPFQGRAASGLGTPVGLRPPCVPSPSASSHPD